MIAVIDLPTDFDNIPPFEQRFIGSKHYLRR